MNYTDVFIRRPVLAAVVSLLILLLGAMGYQLLGVRETPDVQNPIVTVSTIWPGADPAIVESDVSEVLEREINGIEGVRTLTSNSQEGASQITVEFTLERDLEDAANDVRSRVGRARRRLPEDALEPTVEKSDASAQPVMFLRLAAEGMNLLDVTDLGDTVVRDRLENIEGVSGVDLFGAQVYAMRIELDPARMAARGVTLADLEGALRGGNVDLPAGRIEGASTQLTIHFDGGLRTIEQFNALVVRADGPARVYLRDIGSIRLGAENERSSARADGLPSISLAITPQAKANIVEVSDEVNRRIPGIQADLPPGVSLDVVYDRANAVRASIHDVQLTLVVAFALVVAVLFVFLGDWRSTLVPTLAIPVSIIGTFLVLWIAGFTVNVFTLFGLVLAIGIVVDDAIVVLENIVRRVETGESVMEASLAGTRQIAPAVVATTLSLVAVFLPVIFTGGTTGRLFLEFGTTVAASIAISMIVALTLTPMLSSRILRPILHKAGGKPHRTGALARLFAWTLRPVLRYPIVVLPVLVAAGAGIVAGFTMLPREFFPTEDRNMFIIRTQAQEGTSFAWMDARMREVEEALLPLVPERRMMLSRVATGPGGVSAGTNTGMILFPLKHWTDRDRTQQEIVAALKGPLSQVTAFRTIPIQFPTVGRGFSSPVQIVLQHADFDALAAELPAFVKAMREVPGLSSVNEDLRLDRPELRVHPDRERAAELGVPIRDVARTLQVLTSGLDLSTFKRGVRQYKVIAGLAPEQRASPNDLGAIHVRAADGSMVPLSNLLRSDEHAGAAARFHYNRAPSATVSANLDGITQGEAIARVEAMAERELPEGFRTALAGESRDFAEASSSLAQMFLLALALVYLLLAAQFDSFIAPISIMLSVPLALAGAFAALALAGMTLSFFGQVGLILLVGLVTKNGILIVEYARQLQRDEGVDVWTSAERAVLLRFRPILMTSVATIGGAIPIAAGLSGESRASLGVAVVGGMLSATFLTLYVTPVVYAALAGLGGRRVAATLALLCFIPAARAEAPLTLVDALRIARTDNLDARTALTTVRATEAGVDMTRAELLPSLNASAGVAWGNYESGVPGASADAGLRLDATLLDLSGIADLRTARLGLAAAGAEYDAAIEATLTTVAGRFVALQQAREAVAAAEARRGRAARLDGFARSRVAVGSAPRIDQTRAELELRREEARLLAARTAESAATVRLAEALGMEVDRPLDVAAAAPIVPPEALPGDDALDAALAVTHPELLAARRRFVAARADRAAASLASAPTLSAYGQIGARTGAPAPLGVVGAEATVPLYAGGARRAAVRAARAEEARSELVVTEVERSIEADLRLALRGARDAGAALAVAAATVELSREELAQAQARYQEGVGDNLAVVSAQSTLATSEQGRVDALASYNLAVVGWYAARGQVRELAR